MAPEAERLRINTASTGPAEHKAIKPNEFCPALRPPIVWAIPMPSAIINGTVIGPVVTPPESNASGRYDLPPWAIISEANANFVLKRIVYEEYRNFDENTSEWVDITLDTGNGTTQTLHVPKNWPMTIFCHIKANTNAESIKFSDVSSPSGILEGAYDNSTENSDHHHGGDHSGH